MPELFFDTETSGLPAKYSNPSDANYPWIVQLAAVLRDENKVYGSINLLINSGGRPVDEGAESVHHISAEICDKYGVSEKYALSSMFNLAKNADLVICHNFNFDSQLIAASICRNFGAVNLEEYMRKIFSSNHKTICTMQETTNILKLPGNYGKYKYPKLTELHNWLFGSEFEGAHDAMADVEATAKCYYELQKRELIGVKNAN
jgi:DNA polymerase-3 subunit epsilon